MSCPQDVASEWTPAYFHPICPESYTSIIVAASPATAPCYFMLGQPSFHLITADFLGRLLAVQIKFSGLGRGETIFSGLYIIRPDAGGCPHPGGRRHLLVVDGDLLTRGFLSASRAHCLLEMGRWLHSSLGVVVVKGVRGGGGGGGGKGGGGKGGGGLISGADRRYNLNLWMMCSFNVDSVS